MAPSLLVFREMFNLISIVVISFLVLSFFRKCTKSWSFRVSKYFLPPGSNGFPVIGETFAFIRANNSTKGVYDFVMKRHLRYGYCFRTKILGQTHVFISSTDVAKSLLGSESLDFSKRYIKSIGELLGKQSMLCSSHETHGFLRRHISNLFTFDSMTSFVSTFDDLTKKMMQNWEKNTQVVVFNDAMKITFDAICKMIMSLEEEKELETLRHDIFELTEAMLSFPLRFPGTRFYKGLKARERIIRALREKIAIRRKGLCNYKDFLQHLILKDDSAKREEELMTDEQISDNILTLIIAGQITSASAITWMVKYLDENKEIQENLRAKHMEMKLYPDSPLRLETMNEMHFASKIVKETLRMATIVSWFPREALKDCQIGGFQIKKRWIVNLDARSIHYDANIYDNPMQFNPFRFDEDPKAYSFLAFGAGARTCLGMNLAKVMMLVFLHRLVTTYRWSVTDKDSSLEKWAMFPRLRNGCPISVTSLHD
ncbi:hypothetical protein LUZ60_009800 [Juncus effusus]|nr:hypothetical protein LUZ60_009800 [Juncus effusus]